MLSPLYIAGLIRAELHRARSVALGLTRNIGQVLDNSNRVVPFALTQLDDLLADDVIRLLGCLQRAHEFHDRLTAAQIGKLALERDGPDLSQGQAQPPVTA